MDTYETIYLITETLQLAGNAFMDTLSVIFALLVTGYLAGPKLTRPMIWGLVAISALFVVPMISVVQATFVKVAALSASLPKEQFETLPYLELYSNTGSISQYAGLLIVISLGMLYAASIYFVFHSHNRGAATTSV